MSKNPNPEAILKTFIWFHYKCLCNQETIYSHGADRSGWNSIFVEHDRKTKGREGSESPAPVRLFGRRESHDQLWCCGLDVGVLKGPSPDCPFDPGPHGALHALSGLHVGPVQTRVGHLVLRLLPAPQLWPGHNDGQRTLFLPELHHVQLLLIGQGLVRLLQKKRDHRSNFILRALLECIYNCSSC